MSYEQLFQQEKGGYEQLVDTLMGRPHQIPVRIPVRTSR